VSVATPQTFPQTTFPLLGQDPATDLILLYLEEIQDRNGSSNRPMGEPADPNRRSEGGSDEAGVRAAASHTAALSGGDVQWTLC